MRFGPTSQGELRSAPRSAVALRTLATAAVVACALGCRPADAPSQAPPQAAPKPPSVDSLQIPNKVADSAHPSTEAPRKRTRPPPPKLEDAPNDVPKTVKGNSVAESALALNASKLDIRFVTIPAGKFRRGATPEQHQLLKQLGATLEDQLVADERPARLITIGRRFEMSATEITQQQFEAVMGRNPARKKGADLPATNIPFKEAQAFCVKLSSATGRTVRLPTEAEWEYACRAGAETVWFFGDDPKALGEYAWFDGNSDSMVHPVGTRKPNAWGLYDMHGNVWEWCSDWFAEDYYGKPGNDIDPKGPSVGEGHVVRGGAAFDEAWLCRCAERDFGPPVPRVNLGFRIVRELPPEQPADN